MQPDMCDFRTATPHDKEPPEVRERCQPRAWNVIETASIPVETKASDEKQPCQDQ
jgi:hypothetical protein